MENNKNNIEYKYLSHLYPNGKGQDYELVKQIEKQILIKRNYSIDNVAGLDDIKHYFNEEVIQPLINQENQKNKKINDILLYGGPGTGKTFLVLSCGNHEKIKFFNFHPSNFVPELKKECEKVIKIIFDMAKFYSPSILFIDEIDLLYTLTIWEKENEEEKFKSELLKQSENINSNQHKNIIVIGATNRPWKLDDKIIKKLEKKIYVRLLNEKERKNLFELFLKDIKIVDNVNSHELAKLTDGYTNADIYNICQDAQYEPIRKKLKKGEKLSNEIDLEVKMEDIIEAIKNQNKTMRHEDFDKFEKFKNKFGG